MRFSATVIATMLLAGSSALAAERADGSSIAAKGNSAGHIQMARLDTKAPDVRSSPAPTKCCRRAT